MIVESIRLQHIKSYGGGGDGNGVTVTFQPGVNRIAGGNGCGKTTIVEALGYALFSALPVFEERFGVETYLLSHGAKAGEIDVTFRVDGASYRLERGVGPQSKRRSKIVDLADGSICAEDDKEVAAFLCSLLKLPSPGRLGDLFSKLVGVKQGRLVWPFDSKTKDAKEFFEPLLEVEVFRECFEDLKPAVGIFARERAERATRHAVLSERIRERADASEKLETARQEVARQAARLVKADEGLRAAMDDRARQEGLERTLRDAASARDHCAAELRFTGERRAEAERRVRESEDAVERVGANQAAFDQHAAAGRALQALEERRKTRDRLRREREEASKDAIGLAGRRDAARQQAQLLLQQKVEKRAASEVAAGELAGLNEGLSSTAAAFQGEQRAADAAGVREAAVAAWAKGLPAVLGRMKALASGIADVTAELSRFDPAEVERAGDAQRAIAEAEKAARAAAAKTEERVSNLRAQLEQIAGGICPFLGESCPQFDSTRVQADISLLEAALAEDRQRVSEAAAGHQAAEARHKSLVAQENRLKVKRERLERDLAEYAETLETVAPAAISDGVQALVAWVPGIAPVPVRFESRRDAVSPADVAEAQRWAERFAEDLAAWWPGARQRIDEAARTAAAGKIERTRKEAEAQNLAARLTSLEEEAAGRGRDAAVKESEARQLEEAVAARRNEIALLDERLQPLTALDGEIEAQLRTREANKAGHEAYLLAKPQADDLGDRRTHLEALKGQEAEQAATLGACEEALAAARAAFDPESLAAARAKCEYQSGELAAAKAEHQHAETERATQEQRLAEWRADSAVSASVASEIARLTAAIDLTELARTALRKAAPAVAQHLCTRIAVRAQAVYNQINPDPLELEWDAERYSLRITPGDRRFAMLSGGEQTKLALAMTLAMVEEFSRLRFCIFDEPTYGVDADSRRKLADAILQVQDAAGLDQLLLVSHDDAFEGRIEHTVLLTKSAAGGTAVEIR